VSGVIGHDEGQKNKLRAIEFPRIKGGKEFDTKAKWFSAMLKDIGQPKGKKIEPGAH
jgi:diphosphate-dependent phosphofructokinase